MKIEAITKISNNTSITRIYNNKLKKVQKHDDPSSRIIHLNRDELNTIIQELKRYDIYSGK